MICYTNHALDQFLQYCIDECKLGMGIVRVGGRSKSARLDPFLLKNVKRNMRSDRRIDGDIFNRIRETQRKLETIRATVERLDKIVKQVFDGTAILTMDVLKEYMDPDVYEQFKNLHPDLDNKCNRKQEDFALLEWLNLFEIDQYYSLENEMNKLNLSQVGFEEDDEETPMDPNAEPMVFILFIFIINL
jgi:hypothetical protein